MSQLSKNSITSNVELYHLKADGRVPNNPRLPLVVYRGVLSHASGDPASACEATFGRNQWGGGWGEEASSDLVIVGAYPDGHKPDLCTEKDEASATVIEKIRRAPLPTHDPVHGDHGPILEDWPRTSSSGA
jgi:uncharacterized protein YjlB